MNARHVSADRNQPSLLPSCLCDWVPGVDLARFFIGAADTLGAGVFKMNLRGSAAPSPRRTGCSHGSSAAAPAAFSRSSVSGEPRTGIFRRHLTADMHPDHDTIAAFRVGKFKAADSCFMHLPKSAQVLKPLKVGRGSVDGTTLKAGASKNCNGHRDPAANWWGNRNRRCMN